MAPRSDDPLVEMLRFSEMSTEELLGVRSRIEDMLSMVNGVLDRREKTALRDDPEACSAASPTERADGPGVPPAPNSNDRSVRTGTRIAVREDARVAANQAGRLGVLRWAAARSERDFGYEDVEAWVRDGDDVPVTFAASSEGARGRLIRKMAKYNELHKVATGRYRAPFVEEVLADPDKYARVLAVMEVPAGG